LSEALSCDAIAGQGLIERYLVGLLPESEVEALESHYLTCARCQSELRLAAAIRDVLPEVRETLSIADASRAAMTGRRFGRRARIGAVAAALAAVLAGVLLVRPSTIEGPGHREAVPETEIVPTVETPIGEVGGIREFRWAAVTSADLYDVTLYNAAGDVLWQVNSLPTRVALPDTVRLETGVLYLWQVSARVGWDRWVSSELVRFRISEP
jgi:hypothetical protein